MRDSFPSAQVRVGLAYFAILFAAGFAFGTLRVLLLIPRFGETTAVLAEIPVMLALSWWVAGLLTRNRPGLANKSSRLTIGGTALAMLLVAEFLLSVTLFGRSPAAYVASFATLPGIIGIAGQGIFGLIPWLRLKLTER